MKKQKRSILGNSKIFWLLLLVFVLVFSSLPLNNSLDVTALSSSQLDAQADKVCNEQFPRQKTECKSGYKWGYNEETVKQCDQWPSSSKLQEHSACTAGYTLGFRAGVAEDPEENPESQKQKDATIRFCNKSNYDIAQKKACERGYRERIKGSGEDVCDGMNGKEFIACKDGYDNASKKKQTNTTVKLAEQVCTNKYDNDREASYCIRGYSSNKSGESLQEACGDIGGEQAKTACEQGHELANESSESKESDKGGLTDCDLKLLSPISWVMCPLIDLGTNLTDALFQKVITPLLSEVPVSADKANPIYEVWQGFRIIANIMLIGTMLILVYAQTRGGSK